MSHEENFRFQTELEDIQHKVEKLDTREQCRALSLSLSRIRLF